MIEQSVLTLLIVQIISFLSIIVLTRLIFKIPANEMLLLLLCLIFEFLGYFFYSINYFYSTPTKIDQDTFIFSQLGYFFSIISIMSVTYAIILIDFKTSYQNILELLLFSWLGGATSVYNSITTKTSIINGSVETSYKPIGEILIICFFGFVLYIWVKRFLQIAKIYRIQQTFTNVLKQLSLFILLGSSLIIIYVALILVYQIKGDYSFIAGGILTIVGIGILARNNAFLFITDVQLDSIIIIEKKSGIKLYSKIFRKNIVSTEDDSDFIGSIISAINTTLSDTIKSHKDLTEMRFSNKNVLIYSGDHVRSILIVSSSNLIAKNISKHIVKKFEKLFGKAIQSNISNNTFISRKTDYVGFENEIMYIRQFIPL